MEGDLGGSGKISLVGFKGGTTVPGEEEPGGTQHKGRGHCRDRNVHTSLQVVRQGSQCQRGASKRLSAGREPERVARWRPSWGAITLGRENTQAEKGSRK